MKKALLVIDVQSYFLQEAPLNLPKRIAGHIDSGGYGAVIFTVFKGVKGSNFERSLHWTSCLNDSDLVIPEVLERFITTENKFIKTTYSAFFGDELHAYLQKQGITHVELCGIDLEACVLATAYGAFDLGYDTKVLYDLSHRIYGPQDELQEVINRNIQSKNG